MKPIFFPSQNRGYFDHQWLQTYHSFSFAEWVDPNRMGWGALRVLNDDIIQAGQGFGTHGHREMEIVTILLEGELEHQDSVGHREVLQPGMLQHMTAGTGIRHSEFNASSTNPLRLLQIWIYPNQKDLKPAYETCDTTWLEPTDQLFLAAAPEGGALGLHQDGALWLGCLLKGSLVSHSLASNRTAYLFVADGTLEVAGQPLTSGDAMGFLGPEEIQIKVLENCRLVLSDLPK
ncbi:MAG: hypothetical protein A2527_13255 [Candidatus Lambdaproteobacteria bacterium RIFOXYD2_FULL_50_16]|uniref:Quercetin 2,3-dioxygenase n=1 Tax=Candidatus Lambdaproteobacteria bacterium RIFOXYD2_FULL_50_16 TaxID=1817772 RepID=A0A1F6GG96_9PROT|nr:MAG: hypothetical protein A2527_13255 [Candidatus Lambdaproteobacteria bacterium RIFOXYD2_FULL_50_16]